MICQHNLDFSALLYNCNLKMIPKTHQLKSVIYDAPVRDVGKFGTSNKITNIPPMIVPKTPYTENLPSFLCSLKAEREVYKYPKAAPTDETSSDHITVFLPKQDAKIPNAHKIIKAFLGFPLISPLKNAGKSFSFAIARIRRLLDI